MDTGARLVRVMGFTIGVSMIVTLAWNALL